MAKCEKVAIGIDMGTSTCTVGVYQNGQVEILLNDGANCVMPNVALITQGRSLEDATNAQETTSPRNAICDMVKMVSKYYNDKDTENSMKMVPFKVVDVDGQPTLEIMCGNAAERRVTPVDTSTMILTQVKEIAECFLGKPISDAVITVPVYFNEFERKAAKEAANKAGFNVLRVMNEPVAAALAYGFLQKEGKKYALVFDLGGGTLDVSVFAIANGVFDLKATCGNTHLGGKDFDAVIVSHFANEIKATRGIDVCRNPEAMRKLQAVCEQAKRCLSTYNKVAIKIENLVGGVNFESSLSRTKFEELNEELFNSVLIAVEDALDDANISKENISEIVLVGGSTRIPKIQSLLKDFFCGKELTQTINPEEAIAYGAAIQAAVIAKEEAEKSNEVVLYAAPLSVGIKTAGGVMSVFVPRNTALPCSITQDFSTYTDNQPTVLIQIYEGERRLANDNNHLADLELSGLPPAPRGVPRIEVTFCVDRSGIIIVTAQEKATGVKNAVMITRTSARLSKEVDKMVKDSEKNKEKDEENKSTAQARTGLESYCLDLLSCTHRLKDNDYKAVTAKLTDVLKWLECNPKATKEDIACRHEDVEKCCAGTTAILFRKRPSSSANNVDNKPDETQPKK